MSNRIKDCATCTNFIEKWDDSPFNYIDDHGPYCVRCWKFMDMIRDLLERVAKLEYR